MALVLIQSRSTSVNVVGGCLLQDHKAVGDGDTGPNTGGMGSYSPAPVLTTAIESQTMRDIVIPTARAMCAEGVPFRGVLFAGLMIRNGQVGSCVTVHNMLGLGSHSFRLERGAWGRSKVASPALRKLAKIFKALPHGAEQGLPSGRSTASSIDRKHD